MVKNLHLSEKFVDESSASSEVSMDDEGDEAGETGGGDATKFEFEEEVLDIEDC